MTNENINSFVLCDFSYLSNISKFSCEIFVLCTFFGVQKVLLHKVSTYVTFTYASLSIKERDRDETRETKEPNQPCPTQSVAATHPHHPQHKQTKWHTPSRPTAKIALPLQLYKTPRQSIAAMHTNSTCPHSTPSFHPSFNTYYVQAAFHDVGHPLGNKDIS